MAGPSEDVHAHRPVQLRRELREQALEDIDSAAHSGVDELKRLFNELTRIETATEPAVSYQARALSILVRVDAGGAPVLDLAGDGGALPALEPILTWWQLRADDYDVPWH